MGKQKEEVQQQGFKKVAEELKKQRAEYISVYTSELEVNEKFKQLEEINKSLEGLKAEAVQLYNEKQAN